MSYTHKEKKNGDLILAADWNAMSQALKDLSQQVNALKDLSQRITTLEGLSQRITTLEGLSQRVTTLEAKEAQAAPAAPAAQPTQPPQKIDIITTPQEVQQLPPETRTFDFGMEFILIPSGTFKMGSDDNNSQNQTPAHTVNIKNPFWLGKYPVTRKQWRDIMNDDYAFRGYNAQPVAVISWTTIIAFIKKLNTKITIEKDNEYYLPSETQWEYACRAGTKTNYYWGDNYDNVLEYAWLRDNANNNLQDVGTLKPNPWGLFDMIGNVQELLMDNYALYNVTPSDEKYYVENNSKKRVMRSISANSLKKDSVNACKVTERNSVAEDSYSNFIGFRLAKKYTPPI